MKWFLVFAISYLSVSCTIYGVTNDYGKLNKSEKEKIVDFDSTSELSLEKVYKINGTQLLEEIKKHPKVMIYEFTNGCTGATCYPLTSFENYAKENHYTLFLVMNGYGDLNKSLIEPILSPLFAIDNYYYKSNIRGSYRKKFLKDMLLDVPEADKIVKEFYGGIYLFENGKLDKTVDDLREIWNEKA